MARAFRLVDATTTASVSDLAIRGVRSAGIGGSAITVAGGAAAVLSRVDVLDAETRMIEDRVSFSWYGQLFVGL